MTARRARPALTGEDGFTVVEVLVAALVLVVGAMATLALMDASARNTFRAEQTQVINDLLQREMEKVRQTPYGRIATTTAPATSATASNPGYRVSGTNFALNRNGSDLAPMVYAGVALQGGGTVTCTTGAPCLAPSSSFTSGDISGTIYTYVTFLDDPGCPESLCPGAQDIKRVTIAALPTATAPGGSRQYQELQSDFTNPDLSAPGTGTLPQSTNTPVVYSFSDNGCNVASRAAPTANHATHNTLGACTAGVTTNTTPGAPNRLWKASSPTATTEYDYATDVEPTTGAANDRGLQILSRSGCEFTPTNQTNPWRYTHRWVTGTVPTGGNFVLDGAELTLQTRTLNQAVHSGKLCVYLFVRTKNAQNAEVDNLILDKANGFRDHFTYSASTWPAATSTTWSTVTVPLTFDTLRLAPGDRLGVGLSVDSAGTNATMLAFQYDRASIDSKLTVQTPTPSQAPG